MRDLWRAHVYVLMLVAFAILGFAVRDTPTSVIPLILFFGLLTSIAEAYDVVLPHGGTASVSFGIIFASILLLGPWPAVFVALFAAWTPGDIARRIGPLKALATGSILVMCASASGLVFVGLFGRTLLARGLSVPEVPGLALAVGASSMLFFILNTGILAAGMSLLTGSSLSETLLQELKWVAPSYLALAVLGVVIAQVLVSAGPVGVILVVAPLVVARQTFQVYVELRETYQATVRSLVAAVEAKDAYTKGHSERVTDYAESIARQLRLSEKQIESIKIAALLHDLGKVGIHRRILSKTGRLSEDEYGRMQEHPEMATVILQDVDFLEDVIPTIYHHHEHYDGTGYIEQLEGEEIPLAARILTVADAFDAMTSVRPYRGAMSPEDAAAELVACSGSQFDRRAVDALLAATDITPREPGHVALADGQMRIIDDAVQ